MVNKKSAEFPIDKRNCFFKLFICRFFCVSLCLSHMNVFVHIYVCCVFLYKCTSSLHQFFLEFFRCFHSQEHIFWKFLFFIIFYWAMYTRVGSRPSHPYLFCLFHSSILTEMISPWMKCYMHSGVCACVSVQIIFCFIDIVCLCDDVSMSIYIYERSNTLPIYFEWEIGWIVSNICCWFVLMHSAFVHVHFNCKHSFALTNANMIRCNRLKSY